MHPSCRNGKAACFRYKYIVYSTYKNGLHSNVQAVLHGLKYRLFFYEFDTGAVQLQDIRTRRQRVYLQGVTGARLQPAG